ncbi:MAG: YcaO-like family protein [Deltaproteobacteria bacterium]|nr:YcaO-like family protein [Deltaproteobacteria bacterium]
MANELDRLLGFYPLSHQWKSPTLFEDTIEIGDFELKLVGLSAEHESGQMVLGSAAASQGDVLTRAYFELIERTSIIEAVNAAERPFPLVSEFGVMKTTTTSQKVFPQSPDPARWKYSLSSGVAAHTDFSLACRSANWELIERDRILRSWYGEIVPCQIPTHPCSLPAEIESLYDVQWFRFPDGSPNNEVALVLFLPRGQRVLRSYGFGAGLTLDAACSKALSEAMQGMGFLWGEKASADLPDFAPTAEYHQEVFLREEGVRRLQR